MHIILIELLVLIPIGFFTSTLTHELSHLIAVKWQGGRIIGFKIWPHRDMRDGRWNLGTCKYIIRRNANDRAIALAPLVKAIFLTGIFIGLSFIHIPMIILALFEMEDIAEWFVGYFGKDEGSDGKVYRMLGTR